MSIVPLHVVAISLTILLVSFLIIFNLEQLKEYEYLRDEVNCRIMKRAQCMEPRSDPLKITRIVNNIVGDCIQNLMKDLQKVQTIEPPKYICAAESSCETLCTSCEPNVCTKICTKLKPCIRTKAFRSVSYTQMNYADAYLGARIVDVIGTPFECTGGIISRIWGASYGKNPPEKILYSDMEPGCCFAFQGTACVTILLAKPVCIEVIEIAHILKSMSPTRETSSAPKDFKVYGISHINGQEICLGNFVYDNCEPCQLYTIKSMDIFDYVKFEFWSNHGNPEYTCVYKVGVYGKSDL